MFGAINWKFWQSGNTTDTSAFHSLDSRAIFDQFADASADDALDVRQLSVSPAAVAVCAARPH